MTNHDGALLAGRILASSLFVMSGVGKLMAMDPTIAYFTSVGLPMPEIAYFAAVAIELGGGLLLLLGFQTRLIALLLALFCIATAVIGHAHFSDRNQMINFMKNITMAGGFLAFVAAGAGLFSLDALLSRRTTLKRA